MSTHSIRSWESKRTAETREVESALKANFETVDAYRYNSASIRVRVIDARFDGLSREKREDLVDEEIEKLPESIQRDIVFVLCLAPAELVTKPTQADSNHLRNLMFNDEFENPGPSRF